MGVDGSDGELVEFAGGGGAGPSHGPAGTMFEVDTTGVPSVVIHHAAPAVTTGAAGSVTRTAAHAFIRHPYARRGPGPRRRRCRRALIHP
ncbi:MAG: hypothetical protein ACLGG9_01780 [Thermoleophilia bacterium]